MYKTTLELRLLSELGNEKFAMEFAEDIAIEMGFQREKIEDLKIVIAEACLNAIEHGNKGNKKMKVILGFNLYDSHLEIQVQDHGKGKNFVPESIERPNIKDRIIGKVKKRRGLGIYIINNIVDKMEYLNRKDGTYLRIVMKLPGKT